MTPITLKPKEAADMLGIGESTLSEWTRAGYLPSIKIGGVRLYSVRALEEWAYQSSEREETRRGKAAVGVGQSLQAGWGQTLGRGRTGRTRTPRPIRDLRTGGKADAG